MNNKLGKFLEELRGKTPLRTVADKAGLSHTYIRDLELGINRKTKKTIVPSLETLEKLAKAYDYPIDLLIEKSGYNELLDEVAEVYVKKHELEKGLDDSFQWWSKLISDEDGYFYDFVLGDISMVRDKYGINGRYDAPSLFWFEVSDKDDISLKSKILDEIIQICEKHNDFTKIVRKNSNNDDSQLDLASFLNNKGITYNGVGLQETDYKLIRGILNSLFQDRAELVIAKSENPSRLTKRRSD